MCRRVATTLFLAVIAAAAIRAERPDQAPPLPAPDPATYSVLPVDTAQDLADACWNLQSQQAIVIAAGVYDLASVDFPNGVDGRLTIGRFGAPSISDIQIRGATGDPQDVVLLGAGMLDPVVPYGLQVFTATDVLIADLSIARVYYHDVAIEAGQGADRVHLYHNRLYDAGQQIVKGTPGGGGSTDVIVEYNEIFYTDGAVVHPDGSPPNSCYTNGIDALDGHGWIIRHNLIRNISCGNGALAGPSILMWGGSSGTLVDGNTFLDSSRGVSLGLVASSDHSGGIVRNNFFRWDPAGTHAIDVPIYTASPSSKVLHNTVLTHGTYRPAGDNVAVEVRFAGTTGVVVAHNLTDGEVLLRNGAAATVTDNLLAATADWFVDEAAGDLHLRATATAAVDRLSRRSDAERDFDDRTRPAAAGEVDYGASELGPVFADDFEWGTTDRWSSPFP